LAALTGGLTPILCVGEVLSERESGQTEGVLESQLAGALAGLNPEQAAQVIIAYEPVWAIGSGLTATDDQANQAHAHIRRWMALRFNQSLAEKTKILYGGSVKPANAAGLLSQSEVDGVLVGGASLTAASFLGIIEAC
jgi:triosephosphate isomerase